MVDGIYFFQFLQNYSNARLVATDAHSPIFPEWGGGRGGVGGSILYTGYTDGWFPMISGHRTEKLFSMGVEIL